jgi:hypothetical protein
MASDPATEDFVDVYRTDSSFAAQKIVDTLLGPEGIQTLLSDRHVTMVPSPGQEGVHLAVALHDRERAVAIIREAQENGFLDDEEGELLSP